MKISVISGEKTLAGREGPVGLLAAAALFFGIIELATLSLSLLPVPISRGPALGIFLLAAVISYSYFRILSPASAKLSPAPSGDEPSRGTVGIVFGLTALIYLCLWFLAYTLPDFSYDGLYYHNPPVHFWTLKGYIYWIPTGSPEHWGPIITFAWNGYPKGLELLNFVFLQATRASRLLNAGNLILLPWGALAAAALCRLLGAGRRFSLLAGLIFCLIPINIAQSITTMVDLPAAACYLAVFALLIFTSRRIDRGGLPFFILPGLGAALGMAVAAKGPGVILLIGAVFLILLHSVFRPAGKQKIRFLRILNFLVLLLLLVTLTGGFWQLRNWKRTGSPFYPVGLKLGGETIFPGLELTTQFRPPYQPGTEQWTQGRRILANWLGILSEWNDSVYNYDSRTGGLGLFWIAGAVPALLFLLLGAIFCRRERKKTARSWGDLFLLNLLLFFLLPTHHNHVARYTIWLYSLGLPAGAVAAGIIWRDRRTLRRRLGKSWVIGCLLLALGEALYCLYYQSTFIDKFQGKAGEPGKLRRMVSAPGQPYPVGYRWPGLKGSIFEMILSGKDPVAVCEKKRDQHHLIFGHLTQGEAFGERQIYFLDQEKMVRDPDYLRRFIKDNKVRYLIWDSSLPLRRELITLSVWQGYRLADGFWDVFVFNPADL